ncbi:uncharacterized protein E0L32_008703 [Thyridium curvatum]|uniref:NADP-dependent oxidoreductase domain-containing protein n=1 Tax=Thyridium curvatum TaxID=1093900 RepID=A0A507AZY0_9PEZI|nr:uncharacterized protein E0L32_008703 [Thyridium curvatum]TPX10298.1 hypothetical protein E0L32_008703 [Thyridium curvatum]
MSLPPQLQESLDNTKCEYRNLGQSGLRVSVPILGCASFGDPRTLEWFLDEDQSLPLLKAAYDRGLNTWDMANSYSNGVSELTVGKALKRYNIPRHKVVLMTKCRWGVSDNDPRIRHPFMRAAVEASKDYQNNYGLSRTAIFNQVDASLQRLGTNYIDLLHVHSFDYDVPVEETMRALHDLVQSGKVRYLGASRMWATQFARMQFCAERNGWTKFVAMQSQYSLLYREEEREMVRFCNDTGVGLVPWSPLCRGHLARPASESGSTVRSRWEQAAGGPQLSVTDLAIVQRVQEVAEKRGWPMAHVALAWLSKRVTSPIVGLNSIKRLDEATAVRGKVLTAEEEQYLEELYQPKPVLDNL